MKTLVASLGLAVAAAPALAQVEVETAPPDGEYQKVSDLVPLPEFLPGWAFSTSIPPRCRPAPSSHTTGRAPW